MLRHRTAMACHRQSLTRLKRPQGLHCSRPCHAIDLAGINTGGGKGGLDLSGRQHVCAYAGQGSPRSYSTA